ncbi:MAG: hypothetical protein RIQ41_517 [Candidatus Parcubacteria bacterium]
MTLKKRETPLFSHLVSIIQTCISDLDALPLADGTTLERESWQFFRLIRTHRRSKPDEQKLEEQVQVRIPHDVFSFEGNPHVKVYTKTKPAALSRGGFCFTLVLSTRPKKKLIRISLNLLHNCKDFIWVCRNNSTVVIVELLLCRLSSIVASSLWVSTT